MTSREFQEALGRRARRTGLSISPELAAKLEVYFRLLSTWNGKINLTALPLTDPPPETFDRLLVEPVMAARFVAGGARKMMDVGSGGGSPAIPLALAAPQLQLLMVEAKTRKSVFLREAIRALAMTGADVVTSRFEQLLARPGLHASQDLLTLRAVRVESKELATLQSFMKPRAQLFLFRSEGGQDLPDVTPSLQLHATHQLIESDRSRLVVLTSLP